MTTIDITPDTTTDTDPDGAAPSPSPTPSNGAETRHWTGISNTSPWLERAKAVAPAIGEHADRHDRAGTFTTEAFDYFRDHGFLSMMIPTELGGGGASHAETCAVLSEIARFDPAASLSFSMHSHLVAAQVWRHHRGLPAPVLERVAANDLVLISTGASDWVESSGSAVAVNGGFRVTARKMPASGSPAGDVLVTSVRWDDAPGGPQIIHCSIPFAADGVEIIETWDTMGMRGTGSHTVVLDDVFVPEAAVALVRPADRWHPVWGTVLGVALPLIMSSYVGVAEEAVARVLPLAERRAERPDVAPLTGRMLNRLTNTRDAVRAMIDDAENLRFDNTIEFASTALARKSNAAEAAIEVVRLALEVGGGPAYSRGPGIERLFRDVHGALYHPLPREQQERFSGRLALGLDPLAS